MSLPGVSVLLQNGQLGKVDSLGAGKPASIVMMATAPASHAFGVAKKYSTFEELPAEMQAIKALDYFYQMAPNHDIWLMPVLNTTAVSDVVDINHASAYAKKLVEASADIFYFGIIGKSLLFSELAATATKAQALAEYFAGLNTPVAVILPVIYSATLVTLTTTSYDRVAALLSYNGDEMGLLLGRKATIPVQRNIGRVKDGALAATALTIDGTVLLENSTSKITDAHDKGYITVRTIAGKTGYYFTSDHMACSNTSDYSRLGLRCTIDKAHRIAYDVYINELNDDVEIDSAGKMEATVVKHLQGAIEDNINLQMVGEISSVEAYINESQNVISTEKLVVALKIVPKGNLGAIEVLLGFTNPANQ